MLTRKTLRAGAVVSLVGAAMLTPSGQAFALRGGGGGGGVTPSVSGSEGAGYEVQISVAGAVMVAVVSRGPRRPPPRSCRCASTTVPSQGTPWRKAWRIGTRRRRATQQ